MRAVSKYLAHAGLVIGLSFALIIVMGQDIYNVWAGFLSISAIPMMVMLNIFTNIPDITAQPRKGIRMLMFSLLAGTIVAISALYLFQGGLQPPSIVSMMFVIFTVVTMMWLSLVFGGWPFADMRLSGWQQGLAVYALAYILACFLYPFLFDFTAFGPDAALFRGTFPAWDLIVFCVTTLGVIFAFTLFGQLPVAYAAKWGQPWSGAVTGLVVLGVAGATMWTATRLLDINVVAFMVAGPISFMFGVFMVNDVAGGSLLQTAPQPVRGLALLLISGVTGGALYMAYTGFMGLIAPDQIMGAPGYGAELWLANAMLSITFPIILIHVNFFDGWPVVRACQNDGADTMTKNAGHPPASSIK